MFQLAFKKISVNAYVLLSIGAGIGFFAASIYLTGH
jgi:hypothetical protein